MRAGSGCTSYCLTWPPKLVTSATPGTFFSWRAMRLHARRQIDPGQALDHLLAREIAAVAVVEGNDDERKAELRMREKAHRTGQARQAHLERNRHLFFHFLGGAPREKRDHGDL